MSDADEDLLATAEEFQATLTQRILPQLAEAKALLDKQQADLKVLRSLEVDLKKLQKVSAQAGTLWAKELEYAPTRAFATRRMA